MHSTYGNKKHGNDSKPELQHDSLKEKRMKEIERRLHYMRASIPPKVLMHSTKRTNLPPSSPLKKALPDQLIQRGILDNSIYENLKESLHPRSPSRFQTAELTSSKECYDAPLEQEIVDGDMFGNSLPAESVPNLTQAVVTNKPTTAQIKKQEAMDKMIRELSERGYTDEMSKRKEAVLVKQKVDSTMKK